MPYAARRLLVLGLLAGAVSAPFAHAATCTQLSGSVRLDPDPSCAIAGKIPGPYYLGQPGTCFSVSVRGPLSLLTIGTGHAGLTAEGHLSPLMPSAGVTPSILNEAGLTPFIDEFGLPETRRFFTARSAIDMLGGRIFSADAGVIAPRGSSEQLLITGGTGTWAGASGVMYVRGNIISNWASFNGEICK